MNYKQLQISSLEAENIVLTHYNIKAKAVPLPGELDFNFKIEDQRGSNFILKISRPEETLENLNFQQELLQYISNSESIITPIPIAATGGQYILKIQIGDLQRMVRVLTWVPGRLWADVSPITPELLLSLGEQGGKLTTSLKGFNHQFDNRTLRWDIAQGLWAGDYIELFSKHERTVISYFLNQFKKIQPCYSKLPKGIVHNDGNDLNLLVSPEIRQARVVGIIDFGDAIFTQVINDLAVVCTYAVMDFENPLQAAIPIVKGYYDYCELTDRELLHLYTLIGMRLVISLTQSAINKEKESENSYLLVSEKRAWELIKKWYLIDQEYAYLTFRNAIGLEAHPNSVKFKLWAQKSALPVETIFPTLKFQGVVPLDLSVSSSWIGHQKEFDDIDLLQFKIKQYQKQHPYNLIASGYSEPRAIYNGQSYERIGNKGLESRCTHLGVDFWCKENTPVHAAFDGTVVMVVKGETSKGYGGLVILNHQIYDFDFYTIYRHLSPFSIAHLKKGDKITQKAFLGTLGSPQENGGCGSHLHFQLALTLLGYQDDFPYIGYQSELAIWKSISPDPNLLFNRSDLKAYKDVSNSDLISFRKDHLGKSLSLLYETPIKMVRGSGVYLIDQYGQKYLDTVNNVAHVGHECSEVVEAGQKQMALINTNTRYLHSKINALAEKLLKTLPPELSVLHFVNSGSEANELAIRMVKSYTNSKEMIVSEVGYHGNTNACVDISSYKFDGNGGKGKPKHTHVFPIPDSYRGKYRGENTGDLYVEEVKKCIKSITNQGDKVGGFIIEPILSCGGQVTLPEGFLAKAYDEIRNEGGLCISDEVQVGCARVGEAFWGFQLYGVTPDIVTIGKPLGNGHPLAAVVCTQNVADSFANGMEYFNTFGGNPVSCAIGDAVLTYIEENDLQKNALVVGDFLKNKLKALAKTFPIIGDVRGYGLFLGVELVDRNLNPLHEQASYLVQRMKEFHILMSTDGPDNNILKIKPPITFSKKNAETLIYYLSKVMSENFMNLHN